MARPNPKPRTPKFNDSDFGFDAVSESSDADVASDPSESGLARKVPRQFFSLKFYSVSILGTKNDFLQKKEEMEKQRKPLMS